VVSEGPTTRKPTGGSGCWSWDDRPAGGRQGAFVVTQHPQTAFNLLAPRLRKLHAHTSTGAPLYRCDTLVMSVGVHDSGAVCPFVRIAKMQFWQRQTAFRPWTFGSRTPAPL